MNFIYLSGLLTHAKCSSTNMTKRWDLTLIYCIYWWYFRLWRLSKHCKREQDVLQPLICFNRTPISWEQISCSSKLYSSKPRSWHRIRSYSDWKHNRLGSFPQWRGHTSFYIYYKSMNKKTNIYASNHRHKFSQFLSGCLHSYKPIVDYIDTQFENYLQEELKIKRSLFNYHDTRIHICLYFIAPTGHSLKSLDLVTMKKLDSKVQTETHIHSHTCKLWSHTPFSHRLRETISVAEIWPPVDWAVSFHWDVEIPDPVAGVWTLSQKNKAKIGFER